VVITASLAGAEKVSLQDVSVFPELYMGTPIEVEGVNLDGKSIVTDGEHRELLTMVVTLEDDRLRVRSLEFGWP